VFQRQIENFQVIFLVISTNLMASPTGTAIVNHPVSFGAFVPRSYESSPTNYAMSVCPHVTIRKLPNGSYFYWTVHHLDS
jgi:hypothetical protein